MPNTAAVIATLFKPHTLARLMATLERQGVGEIYLIEGMRTNHAWNEGLRRADEAGAKRVFVLNDDIEVDADFVKKMLAHADDGYTWVGAPPCYDVTGLEPQRAEDFPYHRGQAFLMDRTLYTPPIPKSLTVFHGDDWFYWWHKRRGRCCIANDCSIIPICKDGLYEEGFTVSHPDVETFLGESMDSCAAKDHAAARRIFVLPQRVALSDQDLKRNFCGVPQGILGLA